MNILKKLKLLYLINRLYEQLEEVKLNTMKGWKTWSGAVIVAAGAVLEYLGYPEIAKTLMALGAALGLIGIGHKIEKVSEK